LIAYALKWIVVADGNDEITELKVPVPLPIITLLSDVVGLAPKAHTTPLSVTEAPPSAVTLPPKVALTAPTLVAAVVVTVGFTTTVQFTFGAG